MIVADPTGADPQLAEQYLPQEDMVDDNSPDVEAQRADVERWTSRIKRAKEYFRKDFERMQDNQKFAASLQWNDQQDIDDDRYVANATLRMVNQKVATLYARNPIAVAKPRKRLEYQVWDGDLVSLQMAVAQAQQIVASGQMLPPEMENLFQDVQAGKLREALVQRVCETLEILYQYFVDASKPEFKSQAKQMVRRTITCGVGYVKAIMCFEGQSYKTLSTVDHRSGAAQRLARAKAIVENIQEGETQNNEADVETLRSLAVSLGASEQNQDETKLPVRLEFDFPPSTSIIVDDACRNLEEFVAARWIAQEYVLPVAEVNAIFDVDIEVGQGEGTAVSKTEDKPLPLDLPSPPTPDVQNKNLITLWEIFDYTTKTRCFICNGWRDYLVAPEPVYPSVAGFWPIQALVFNAIEAEPGCKASIYPPSDVQLIKSAQMEWNRTRDALRAQRNANAPKYLVRKGALTIDDKNKLRTAQPNSVIELEGCPPDQKLSDFLVVMQVAQIDPKVYDTAPLEQDMLLSGGMQQANIGPAQPDVTATVGSIAEQSRMTVVQSNIDDLDGVLSRLAQMGGEMLLRALPSELATKIAGPGAAMPEQTREDFVDEVFLTIQAASAGRPNKAVEVSNFQQLAPILLQAGANPVGVIEEGARRLDDQIDLSKFFPVQVPAVPQEGESGMGAPSGETGLPPSANPAPGGPISPNGQMEGGDHQLNGPQNPQNVVPMQ